MPIQACKFKSCPGHQKRERADDNQKASHNQIPRDWNPTSPGGGIGRRARFRCVFRKECRFKSCSGHHKKTRSESFFYPFSFFVNSNLQSGVNSPSFLIRSPFVQGTTSHGHNPFPASQAYVAHPIFHYNFFLFILIH